MKYIKLTKLTARPDAKYPQLEKYPEGSSREGLMIGEPEVGESFYVDNFGTSVVQEIIDENTFKTMNTFYKWETIREIGIEELALENILRILGMNPSLIQPELKKEILDKYSIRVK